MDRVDPDGNLYRFYVYKDMASEIEYFCTEEAGNMTIPIGEGKYIEIVPREIVKIPVRGYRRLAGKWNCETCYGKGWYRLFNYFKYKPDICYIKNIGRDKNGNTRYEISLFNATMNVTRYFNLWRMKPGKHAMITTTFWEDFSIADKYGIAGVKDTYKRAFSEWKDDYKFFTELTLVLNHKIWQHYESNHELAALYDRLWREADEYAMNNFKGEELDYYYRVTD